MDAAQLIREIEAHRDQCGCHHYRSWKIGLATDADMGWCKQRSNRLSGQCWLPLPTSSTAVAEQVVAHFVEKGMQRSEFKGQKPGPVIYLF